MSPLLWRSSRRYLMRHPWQAGLAILGVALGVAVVVSIELANGSAQSAFALSTEAVTGRATHEVSADGGLDEDLLRQVKLAYPQIPAAPIVEGFISLDAEPGRAFPLLGVDPFAEGPFRGFFGQGRWLIASQGSGLDISSFLTRRNAVLLDRATGVRLNVKAGDSLPARVEGRAVMLWVAGLLGGDDSASRRAITDLLIADLSTAQELLGSEGRLSRIDLILPMEATIGSSEERIRASLPQGVTLKPTAARQQNILEMTRAFRLNLRALALLALVCGVFLIYNTMTFSVVQRRPLLGRIRALGVTRREIFALVLGEAAAIGALGTALGLVLGVVLGRGLVKLVARTVNDFYFRVATTDLVIDPAILARGALLGLGAALLAALAPAIEATSTAPGAVLRRSYLEESHRRSLPRTTLLALLLLAISAGLLALPSRSLALSFSGLALGMLAAALLAPLATVVLSRLAGPPLSLMLGILGRMAARGVVASLSRTGVAIATLMITVSVTVGVGVMVASFRTAVESWLETVLKADLYVAPVGRMTAGQTALFDDALVDRLQALPGIAKVNTLRWRTVETPRGPTILRSVIANQHTRDTFVLSAGSAEESWSAFAAGSGLLVSEPLAYMRRLEVGDTVRLETPVGPRAFSVAGIFVDYAADQGAYLIARRPYQELWGDRRYGALALIADGTVAPELLVEATRRATEGLASDLLIQSTGSLRQESIEIFDRTFLITGVLRMLAGIVALIGVLSALMALQLERGHELAVLRANGLTPGQLLRLVTTQTGLMGAVAGLLSMPVGLAMAGVMIYIINRRSFGWSLEMQWSPLILLQALALSLAAALLAGLYPAFKMAATSPAQALREE